MLRILPSLNARYTNLYVNNLDLDVTEELLEKFSEFGKILSLIISKDEYGASRGFGFVNFDSADDAMRAIEAMNRSQLGRLCFLNEINLPKRSELLSFQWHGSNVYVKNFDDDVIDDELREHFSQCSTITSTKLMRDEKGTSKGFGFVCFSTPKEANKAVNNFHGEGFHDWTLSKSQYLRLRACQQQSYTHYFYEVTVRAGLPIISTLQGVLETWDKILRIEGIFRLVILVDENDAELPDFCKYYEKSHKLNKTNNWIDSRCGDLHVDENDAELPDFCKYYEKSHKLNKTNNWIDSRCGDLHKLPFLEQPSLKHQQKEHILDHKHG
ncbi:hypothetical protein TEA_003259 [Camellia sinensis var. sinensis]|uniref:RRM domain-containing protein n=1 Tax=Camellia sinensis var. sinensis TaxID=542762 RepID=A0A4S4E3H1_CAMSN|nr:hypothetical protein TEA_003259 [Camellia sinensis var. sinensis]